MRKRYYILFVTRDSEGELRKIPIPLHYLYVFLAGALLGMFTITGMAGSYTRMLMKTARFNQLRTEKEALSQRYNRLERVAEERELQAASLGSLADEVATLYGLKPDSLRSAASADDSNGQPASPYDRLYTLRTTAMTGAATLGISMGMTRNVTVADWVRLRSSPTLWPVEGLVTGSFGERMDPFNGEGAFHSGVDISSTYGRAVLAPGDGVVVFADIQSGYGRMAALQHGDGLSTRFGHLAGFTVAPGQQVRRGDVIGYIGLSGRSTGPHLHYEVRINGTPVNPHRFLRATLNQYGSLAAGLD